MSGGRSSCPILHSRVLRVLSFPVVAWLVFAGVMWGTHFSPLFDRSLEDPLVHDLEHALYLGAGLLFWWPAVGLDPSPWRMPHPVRAMYVFLQMPQNTFLAVTILNAPAPLYPHYATLARTWGPSALDDQQIAGGPDVDRRRHPLPGGDRGDPRRLDAPREAPEARPTGGAMPSGPRSGSGGAPGGAAGRGARGPLTAPAAPRARERRLEELQIALRVDVAARDDGDDRPVEAVDAGLG